MSCVLIAVTLMPLGDALTLFWTSPLFTMLLSAIFMRHRLRLYKLSFALILIFGIILVVQPPSLFPPSHDQHHNSSGSNGDATVIFDTRFNIGIVAGIGGAIIASLLNISVRYLKDTSPNVLIFYGGLGGLLDVLVMFKFD